MSFVFHPSVLQGAPRGLLLQELKTLALQLDRSRIMDALFSPTTVPLPPRNSARPSNYAAPTYLPPKLSDELIGEPEGRNIPQKSQINAALNDRNSPQQYQQNYNVENDPQQNYDRNIGYNPQQSHLQTDPNFGNIPQQIRFIGHPNIRIVPQEFQLIGDQNFRRNVPTHPSLRRALIQIDTDSLNQDELNQFQNGKPKNSIEDILHHSTSSAINNFMRFQQEAPFDAISKNFDQRSDLMNNYFNNQLQVPQFPTFPYFANQYQSRSQSVQPMAEAFPQFQLPQFPAFPSMPKFPKSPYISPNLMQMMHPTDDIDVRMDKRTDEDINDDKQNKNVSQGQHQVIQIGTGNTNYAGESVRVDQSLGTDDENVEVNVTSQTTPMALEDDGIGDDGNQTENISVASEAQLVVDQATEMTEVSEQINSTEAPIEELGMQVDETIETEADEGELKKVENNDDEIVDEPTGDSNGKEIADPNASDKLEIMNQVTETSTIRSPVTTTDCMQSAPTTVPTDLSTDFAETTINNDVPTTMEAQQSDDEATTDPSATEATTIDAANRLDASTLKTLTGWPSNYHLEVFLEQ